MMEFVLDVAENVVERGENTGYQHFLLFFAMFKKAKYVLLKSWDSVVVVSIQQQIKNMMQKYGQMGYNYLIERKTLWARKKIAC